jgi:acyl-CoA dehydrogenase
MDFALSPTAQDLQARLLDFMDSHVYPAEQIYRDQRAEATDPHHHPPVIEVLKAEARSRGLWNLFLPHATEWTDGLSNTDYAPLAEIMGSAPLTSEATNCSAPDTGNMELLAQFASPLQREQYLQPLLDGEIRSGFAMTEPWVASSDATNIESRIVADGDSYVIDAHKWWTTGAASDRCTFVILMGVSDPDADPHRRHSMIIVPLATPGVTNVRTLPVLGHDAGSGHCELLFEQVRVPKENLLGREGEGFALAQARLGPGRIHHCMRAIGVAERALEMAIKRAKSRVAFGQRISEMGVTKAHVADMRMEIDMARLLVLKAAWAMDKFGNKEARQQIAMIKVAVPNITSKVVDRCLQLHGAGGVSQVFKLASMYAHQRTLRLADGPDEVHKMTIARRELRRHDPDFRMDAPTPIAPGGGRG